MHPTEKRRKSDCLAYGVATPYGDYFRKLTKCLVDDFCVYKMQFGKHNLCIEEERRKKMNQDRGGK